MCSEPRDQRSSEAQTMLRAPLDAIRWWNAWWLRRATHWKGAYYAFAIAFVLFSLTGGPETSLSRIVIAAASVGFSVGMGFWFSARVRRRFEEGRPKRRRD
jgi:hypothetical protein